MCVGGGYTCIHALVAFGGGGCFVFCRRVDNDLLLLAANIFICSVQEEMLSSLRPAFCSVVCKRIPFAPMINN